MMTDKDIDLISKFLDNELSDPEIDEFKLKYSSDTEFSNEVKVRAEIYISLEAAAKVSIKNVADKPLLRKISDTGNNVKSNTYSINKWFIRIAAVVLPLIGIGIGIELWNRPGSSNDELFLSYYQNGKNNSANKTLTTQQLANFQILQKDIDTKILETLDILSEPTDIYNFGVYCLEKKLYNEAIYAFNRVITLNSATYLDSSEWYLGLCYLKIGQDDKAVSVFTSIIQNTKHKYFKESQEILKKLGSEM